MLDLRAVSTVADFFVICTAQSSRQIRALQEHIETVLERRGCTVDHLEGTGSGGSAGAEPQWVLMDCQDLVVHLFDPLARAFYRLEHLWADAPRVPVTPTIRAGAA